MKPAEAKYDWNGTRKCWEWTIHMYGYRLCCAFDELTARLTALALNEFRFAAAAIEGDGKP